MKFYYMVLHTACDMRPHISAVHHDFEAGRSVITNLARITQFESEFFEIQAKLIILKRIPLIAKPKFNYITILTPNLETSV